MKEKWWRFDSLWTGKDYLSPAYIHTDANGIIQEKTKNTPQAEVESFSGFALPGFQNTHSHAFQYALRGKRALSSTAASNDFCSWRNGMYEIAAKISLDCVEAVAAQLYTEMLRHGYTSVVEFNYLHHDESGKHYPSHGEIGKKHIAAALQTGIRLFFIPIFYGKEGLIPQKKHEAQKRFHTTVEEYHGLVEELQSIVKQAQEGMPSFLSLGRGVHSLRAIEEKELLEVCENLPEGEAFHMHIAEQEKEVRDCEEKYGISPLNWLFDRVEVKKNFHFVHATHARKEELEKIAKAKASIILCPSTEANLGDGFFDFSTYRKLKGIWSIGTDSHVGLSPMEELRCLDYGLRLREKRRDAVCPGREEESANILYEESRRGALHSMGKMETTCFAPGTPLDAIVTQSPNLESSSKKLSSLIYSATLDSIKYTIVNGRVLVKEQKHIHGEKIQEQYKKALAKLFA